MIDRLQFKGVSKDIDLELQHRITMIEGNSGIGKTYVYSALEKISLYRKDIITINKDYLDRNETTFKKVMDKKKPSTKYIIIDNADIIITKSDKKIINMDNTNIFIIMGRNNKDLWTTEESYATLVENNNTLKLEFPYINVAEKQLNNK